MRKWEMGNEEMEMGKWQNSRISVILGRAQWRNIKADHQVHLLEDNELGEYVLRFRMTSSPSPDIILAVSLTRPSHSQERVWYFTVQLIVAAVCTRGRTVHKPHIRLLSQHPRKSWSQIVKYQTLSWERVWPARHDSRSYSVSPKNWAPVNELQLEMWSFSGWAKPRVSLSPS